MTLGGSYLVNAGHSCHRRGPVDRGPDADERDGRFADRPGRPARRFARRLLAHLRIPERHDPEPSRRASQEPLASSAATASPRDRTAGWRPATPRGSAFSATAPAGAAATSSTSTPPAPSGTSTRSTSASPPGVYDNPTIEPSVNATLATILGREAARRRTKLTLDELLHENRRLEPDLTGLTA